MQLNVVDELLTSLSDSQQVFTESAVPNLSGRWKGTVSKNRQTIDLVQSGPVVHIEGTAYEEDGKVAHQFRGSGRVVYDMLIFSWTINEGNNGINVMKIRQNGQTIDGKFFNARSVGSGYEIYEREASTVL